MTRLGNVRTLLVTLAVQMLVSMAVLTVPVLAPAAAPDVGIPAAYVGLYIGLVYGAGMLSSAACGDLIRRFGAIRVSQACLLLTALGAFVSTTARPQWFLMGALLMGAGYGPVTPASSHVLARTTPPHAMSLVFSLKQTGVPLGGALAGLLVPPIVLLAGWRWALVGVGVVCMAIAAMAQSIRHELDGDRSTSHALSLTGLARPLRTITGDDALRRLATFSFFFSAVQLCLTSYLVTYLHEAVGYTLVQAGLMLSAAQAGGVFARIGWGALADRLKNALVVLAAIAGGMVLSAIATALIDVDWPLVATALVCAAFGATAIGWNGVFLAEVARRAPAGRAADATGGVLAFTYFGVLIAPPLFGVAVEHGLGYPAAYIAVVVPAGVIAVRLLLWQRGQRAATHPRTQETS